VDRRIVGFHLDPESDWVAELDCGHNQHVRHRPPFQMRPWVLNDDERAAQLGTPLDCPLCERGEAPESLRFSWRSARWDARTLPTGLRRAHKLASGTWGRLVVEAGRLAFRASTVPPIDRVLDAGSVQAIPPGVEHEIEPGDDARVFVEFFEVVPYEERVPVDAARGEQLETEPEAGGDPACWAHLFCPACGNALDDGHVEGCSLVDQEP
jgi:tellurite methyltransferase